MVQLMKLYAFDATDVCQSDNTVAEAIKDCMQYFHRFKHRSEHKAKAVRGESGEDEAFFTTTNGHGILFDPIDKRNELDVKINEDLKKCFFQLFFRERSIYS